MVKKKKSLVNIDNASVAVRSNYADVIQKILDKGHCPFCANNLLIHHTKSILFKGTHWLITENAWPYEGTQHHFLLISRTHVEHIEKMSPSSWSELQRHFKRLCKMHNLKGATLLFRSGDTAMTGASVQHLHAQIIVGHPRSKKSSTITALVGFT